MTDSIFSGERHRQVYDKVHAWLKELYGDLSVEASEKYPSLDVETTRGRLSVWVGDWKEKGEAVVQVYTYVVREPPITVELLTYLLQENNKLRVGGFCLDGDKDVLFRHSMLGATCDKPELTAACQAILAAADRWNEEILSRFGGKRAGGRSGRGFG
jgi:hypothetical protein